MSLLSFNGYVSAVGLADSDPFHAMWANYAQAHRGATDDPVDLTNGEFCRETWDFLRAAFENADGVDAAKKEFARQTFEGFVQANPALLSAKSKLIDLKSRDPNSVSLVDGVFSQQRLRGECWRGLANAILATPGIATLPNVIRQQLRLHSKHAHQICLLSFKEFDELIGMEPTDPFRRLWQNYSRAYIPIPGDAFDLVNGTFCQATWEYLYSIPQNSGFKTLADQEWERQSFDTFLSRNMALIKAKERLQTLGNATSSQKRYRQFVAAAVEESRLRGECWRSIAHAILAERQDSLVPNVMTQQFEMHAKHAMTGPLAGPTTSTRFPSDAVFVYSEAGTRLLCLWAIARDVEEYTAADVSKAEDVLKDDRKRGGFPTFNLRPRKWSKRHALFLTFNPQDPRTPPNFSPFSLASGIQPGETVFTFHFRNISDTFIPTIVDAVGPLHGTDPDGTKNYPFRPSPPGSSFGMTSPKQIPGFPPISPVPEVVAPKKLIIEESAIVDIQRGRAK